MLFSMRIPDVVMKPVLGPILFNVFISDLHDGIEHSFSKSADNKRQGGAAGIPLFHFYGIESFGDIQ